MGKPAEGVLGLIGGTPLVRLENLGEPKGVSVYAKLEVFNPGGSVKDRICIEMIRRAEESGELVPGGTIVEPTAGNTGVGFAICAATLGYKFIAAMPEKFDGEKADLMRAFGAEVVLTPNEAGMQGAIDKADEIAERTPASYVPNQFFNQANPDAHYKTTGAEIWRDMKGKVDAFVAGCGTGGTFTGVARYLKERNPDVKCFAVEPVGSTIGGGEKGSYNVEGIGNWFVPGTLDLDLVDRFIQVADEDSFSMTRKIALAEGLAVGSSSGAACYGALAVAAEFPADSNIVTVFPDSGERYLSKKLFEAKG
jgi:cysteine synthase A